MRKQEEDGGGLLFFIMFIVSLMVAFCAFGISDYLQRQKTAEEAAAMQKIVIAPSIVYDVDQLESAELFRAAADMVVSEDDYAALLRDKNGVSTSAPYDDYARGRMYEIARTEVTQVTWCDVELQTPWLGGHPANGVLKNDETYVLAMTLPEEALVDGDTATAVWLPTGLKDGGIGTIGVQVRDAKGNLFVGRYDFVAHDDLNITGWAAGRPNRSTFACGFDTTQKATAADLAKFDCMPEHRIGGAALVSVATPFVQAEDYEMFAPEVNSELPVTIVDGQINLACESYAFLANDETQTRINAIRPDQFVTVAMDLPAEVARQIRKSSRLIQASNGTTEMEFRYICTYELNVEHTFAAEDDDLVTIKFDFLDYETFYHYQSTVQLTATEAVTLGPILQYQQNAPEVDDLSTSYQLLDNRLVATFYTSFAEKPRLIKEMVRGKRWLDYELKPVVENPEEIMAAGWCGKCGRDFDNCQCDAPPELRPVKPSTLITPSGPVKVGKYNDSNDTLAEVPTESLSD